MRFGKWHIGGAKVGGDGATPPSFPALADSEKQFSIEQQSKKNFFLAALSSPKEKP